MPAALQFATEVTAYLNKQYALNLKLGVGALDQPIIQWHFELDSADELAKLNDKLAADQEYLALVEKYKDTQMVKTTMTASADGRRGYRWMTFAEAAP